MKLPVYPISSFYFIRGKLSSIRSGTTPTSGQSSKEPQFANLLLRNAPLKPDPDMEKRLNDPLIQNLYCQNFVKAIKSLTFGRT